MTRAPSEANERQLIDDGVRTWISTQLTNNG